MNVCSTSKPFNYGSIFVSLRKAATEVPPVLSILHLYPMFCLVDASVCYGCFPCLPGWFHIIGMQEAVPLPATVLLFFSAFKFFDPVIIVQDFSFCVSFP